MAYKAQFADKIEAILFISGNPVPFDKLCEIFSLTPNEMLSELEHLEKLKAKSESGLSLIKIDGSYQLCTKQETSEFVKKFLEMKKAPPLSKAALEVLAITAYHQPVTRSFIEHVRGIDSSSIVAGLEDKGLITSCGHLDAPGHPVLFVTTEAFLRSFGLESIDDLPPLPTEFLSDNGQMKLEFDSENADSESQSDSENADSENIDSESNSDIPPQETSFPDEASEENNTDDTQGSL